jgi:hypothetical protein
LKSASECQFVVKIKRLYNCVMRKSKLYLETSVCNFLFADDAPDKKKATEKFFSEVKRGNMRFIYLKP